MTTLLNITSLFSLIASTLYLIKITNKNKIYEKIMFFFLFSTSQLILIAFALSTFNQLGNIQYWALANTVFLTVVLAVIVVNKKRRLMLFTNPAALPEFHIIKRFKQLSVYEKLLLLPVLATASYVFYFNLSVVVYLPPQNWDSLSYHLPRVAYYLQHGNLNYFPANYWAQVVHAKNSAILLLYIFLISGRNENLFQLAQFIAYIVCLFTVYGISRRIKLEWQWALLASLAFGLFVEVLMEAVTPQNDLLITAYVGITVYFLLLFKEDKNIRNLLFAILSMGIGIGVKASFLTVLPSIFLIAVFLFTDKKLFTAKKLLITLVFAILITVIFILPAGYLENYKLFNNPLGPKEVLEHSFSGKPVSYVLRNGSLNILRFGLDFLTLDGLPAKPPISNLQLFIKKIPLKLLEKLNIVLTIKEVNTPTFNGLKMPISNEDNSYPGIMGFAILLPAIIFVIFNYAKNYFGVTLALGWLLFFLVQAFSGPYDPFRGRYFMYALVFTSPLIGFFIREFFHKKSVRMYVYVIFLIGCISAVGAVKMRHGYFLEFKSDRLTMLWDFNNVFKKYESMVPRDAVVAVCFKGNSMEYQLFGEGLTRTIIPINSFTGKTTEIPSNADYLIYQNEFKNKYKSEADTYLGAGYYLKKLK